MTAAIWQQAGGGGLFGAAAPFLFSPEEEADVATLEKPQHDGGWNVIVWNDHINTQSYVVHVFRKVLGFDEDKARRHMLEVHHQGKSCVARERREKAELFWEQLQGYGLRVSLQKAEA